MMDIMLYAGGIYKGEKLIGTGFVIDPENRLLVTARHVLDNFRVDNPDSVDGFYFRLFTSENKVAIKSQVASKPRNQEDIVLLELSEGMEKTTKAPTFISYVMPTSDVWTVGYAGPEKMKGNYKPAQGKLSGYTTKNGVRVYELDIDGIYNGMSGSPVMLGDKGIIGILTTKIDEKDNLTAWVTPVDAFAGLDDRIKIPRIVYLQNLIESLSARDPILDVEDYVPVRVTVTTPGADSEPMLHDNIFDVLPEYPKFNLIGDAGSGKTTALKRMALYMAKEALKHPDASVPVWMNLSEWRHEQTFADFLEQWLSTPSNKSIKNYYPLENLLEDSKIILFLDEFDEVEGKNVSELKKWITQTEVRTYIGCRDTYFFGNWKINIPTVRIEPLNTLEAYQFAERYFKSTERADEFMSTIAPDGYIDYKTSSHVSQLASNPLFLIMMLADYQKGSWRTSQDQIRIPTIWKLFRGILKQLWDSSRVLGALQEKPHLALEYNDIDIVIRKLSKLAFKFSDNRSIPKAEIQKIFPEEVISTLNDSRIIKINPATQSYRFLHALFADYITAHEIKTENIDEYIKETKWLSILFILSTRDEADRKIIQDTLLRLIVDDIQENHAFSLKNQKQVLGDIGDRHAIDILLSMHEKNPKRTDLFHPLAKIANRLPDGDDQKAKVIQLLKKVMFSAAWMNRDLNGEVLSGLDWLMGDYTAATEAMALIKTPDAVGYILQVLDQSARFYDDKIASGSVFRQQWFSDYLSSMGEWVIPKLLEAIDSDHPDVTTTIANALLKINRPLDVSKIGTVMLSHPVPMVRANLAYTLGKLKGQDATAFLEKSLKDNQIWSRGTFAIRWRHFFVSDSAAESLASIGDKKALAILADHKYQPNGVPTPELLLERLESGFDVKHRDSLRTQIANRLAGLGRLDLLLPRLGHIDLYTLDGYASPCPIAEALIQRCEDAHAEDRLLFEDRVFDYVDPTDEILAFLDTSSDLTSRCWAVVVLGNIGKVNMIPITPDKLEDLTAQPIIQDVKILPMLRKYLLDNDSPDLREAAAYGLGCFVKRQKSSPQSAMEFAAEILNLTGSISPGNYTGVGMGLMKIVSLCAEAGASYTPTIDLIRTSLLEKIDGQSITDSKIALDALETISISCPAFLNAAVSSVLEVSPTYFFKMANREYKENGNIEAYPGMRDRINYDGIFDNYIRALQESSSSQTAWKKAYADADWEELGLRKDRLFHQLGKVYVVDEKWPDAFDAFLHSLNSIPLQNITTKDERFFAIYACSELGNLQMRFLDQEENALQYFAQALALSKDAEPTELTDTNLSSVLCNSILNYQKFFIPRQENNKVIEIGMESDVLLSSVDHIPDDDLAMIYLNTSTSLILSRRLDEANRYAQMAHEKLLRSSNRQLKVGSLLRIAELQKAMGENAQAENNILEAIASAKRSGDDALEALSQMALAHSLDSNSEIDRVMAAYQRALLLFGDEEHEKVLQEKAGIHHEMAVLYQNQEKYEQAESAFKTAIHLVQRITPAFPNMPYVIQAEYAKFLHLTDRHDEAIDLLMHLAQEMMLRGMNPGIVQQMLSELDTPEGNQVPDAAAKQWAEALVYVSQGRIDEAEFVEKMYAMLKHFNENGWRNEEMYVLSLLDLWADQKRQVITEANPYYKFYQWAKEHYR